MNNEYLLIVDDDADVREILCEVLTDAGYLVVAVADGRAALDHLLSHPEPFLILLDLMMPIVDGRQFRIEQLRVPELSAIPVVVLTANERADRAEELRDLLCLQKPIALERLLAVVKTHFDARVAPRAQMREPA